jgi:hypothetical protein
LDGNGLAFLFGDEAADLDDGERLVGGEVVVGAGEVVGELDAVVDHVGIDSGALPHFFLHGFGNGKHLPVLFEEQSRQKCAVYGDAGSAFPTEKKGEKGVVMAMDNIGR